MNRDSLNASQTYGILNDCLLRGWAGMCLGGVIYKILDVCPKTYSKTAIGVFRLGAVLFYSFVIYMSLVYGNSKFDCYYVFALAFAVGLSFVGYDLTSYCQIGKIKLSKLTYGMYLNQTLVISFFYGVRENRDCLSVVLIIAICIVYSMITTRFVDFITKGIFARNKKEKR